ncbi:MULTISPECIES: hypothetical protein [Bacillaceae]|uniref:Pyruvate carboxyltransferase domain-containing protein n=1 Tax=Domibacillus aminovorans TaxID=29332 RepID=A0A177KYC9_9BACI|nr:MULTISPECIES: hypothetical protein [Bacillaceae]OAH58014.1 hypothetical protein AWH48_03140 [Domibacillus aminovorans]
MHFYAKRETALANIVKSLEMGITTFDSALGGLGGCLHTKGSSGNVATEDLLCMLHEMGIETEIDFNAVVKSAQLIEKVLGKKLNSHQMDILHKGRKGCLS